MGYNFSDRLLELSARESRDNIPLATAIIIIISLGVLGNVVTFLFFGIKDRHTVTNFLIAVLSLNDIMVNLVFYDELLFHFNQFIFTSTIGCKMIFVINNWLMMNSVSLMFVIAIERYRKICNPFSCQVTHIKARLTAVCVTLTTLIICSKEAFFVEIVPEHIRMNDNSTVIGYVCTHSHDKQLKPFIKGSNLATMLIYLSLFVSLITAYVLIIKRIYKINKASTAETNNKRFSTHEVIEMNESTNTGNNETASKDDTNTTETQNDSKDNKPRSRQGPNLTQPEIKENNVKSNTIKKSGDIQDEGTDSIKDSDVQKQETDGKQKKKTRQLNKLAQVEKKITKMVIIVAIASILSFVPYLIVILLVPSHHSTEDQLSNMTKKVFRESYKLNAVLNPYIMCIFNQNFRQFVKNIFCRCFTWKS